ncbi:MAG: hypothetical protein L0229_29280 [Blastocatellia bacterium]|nr:hypothetical protein [Blastocatellia bacterium]
MNGIEPIDLLLNVAAREAVLACYREITPAHLLIALSRLSELTADTPVDGATLRGEFEKLGIEPTRFRRRLRALLGDGGEGPPERTIHRSPECKAVFALAQAIAVQQGASLSPEHLLCATLLSLARINDPQARQDSEILCSNCHRRMRPSFASGAPYCPACGRKIDYPGAEQGLFEDEIPTEL